MSITLTPLEEAILKFIQNWIKNKGYPPSVREIGKAVGLKSSSSVHNYLLKLEKKGLLRRDAFKPRAMEVVGMPAEGGKAAVRYVPMVGDVAAGNPIIALEEWEEMIPLPAEIVGEGECFALKIKGDSMIEAGIYEGDVVIVRRQPVANNGDIVVALLGEEATVKRFFRENGRVRLQPANSQMAPLIINPEELIILGKVVALVRKY